MPCAASSRSLRVTADARQQDMATWGLLGKVGEAPRPSTYKGPPQPEPNPTTNEQAWLIKSKVASPGWVNSDTILEDSTSTAQAWLKHPANKMQLKSFQKAHDTDGDGLIDASEFKQLLKAAGSSANADVMLAAMDADGDGVLDAEEIKALGQGQAVLRGV